MGRVVRADGRLAVDQRQAAAVARARELRVEGLSLREIAAALDAEGHRPRGRRWHRETLSRMVVVSYPDVAIFRQAFNRVYGSSPGSARRSTRVSTPHGIDSLGEVEDSPNADGMPAF